MPRLYPIVYELVYAHDGDPCVTELYKLVYAHNKHQLLSCDPLLLQFSLCWGKPVASVASGVQWRSRPLPRDLLLGFVAPIFYTGLLAW